MLVRGAQFHRREPRVFQGLDDALDIEILEDVIGHAAELEAAVRCRGEGRRGDGGARPGRSEMCGGSWNPIYNTLKPAAARGLPHERLVDALGDLFEREGLDERNAVDEGGRGFGHAAGHALIEVLFDPAPPGPRRRARRARLPV